MVKLQIQFARKLKALRIERRLTQQELAEMANLSTSFISSLERGIDAPSFTTLERIAKALDVTVKDLFDFGG